MVLHAAALTDEYFSYIVTIILRVIYATECLVNVQGQTPRTVSATQPSSTEIHGGG